MPGMSVNWDRVKLAGVLFALMVIVMSAYGVVLWYLIGHR